MIKFITDREIYEQVVLEKIPKAKEFLWIGTSDIKDMYVKCGTGMRIHFKCVVIDGKFAYSGSANLTGAGMGAKSETRRNFEAGIVTDDELIVSQIIEQFDSLWMGKFCEKCKRKEYCADYKEILI